MLDSFKRNIEYLRISVTDRCNLRCTYCMPEDGVQAIRHSDILSFEEILDFTKIAVGLGISKVRITGGEPLVRKGIVQFIHQLGQIDGIKDLAMTTNGTLLKKFSKELAGAGLHRINVSLDTTDPEEFKKLTRGGNIQDVFDGIHEARKYGLEPIKLNCVLSENETKENKKDLIDFASNNDFQLRFIHQMNLHHGSFSVVEGGTGGDCSTCNRLRLTANGIVKPCLFSDLAYKVREIGAKKAILAAISNKPLEGSVNNYNEFCNIGG